MKGVSGITPGPWTTDADVEHEAVLARNGTMVADCCITVRGRKTAENVANARLIARAPELLLAVKGLHIAELHRRDVRSCDRDECPLCELIASAEGL